jgi:hypothetical protein
MLQLLAELHTLHLQSGVLLFTSCATTLMAPNQSSKIILADMALIVTPGAVEKLKPGNVMIGAVSKDAAVSLDRCTFKAEVDSPQLAYLTACVVGSGTQVGGVPSVYFLHNACIVQLVVDQLVVDVGFWHPVLPFQTAGDHEPLQVPWVLAGAAFCGWSPGLHD